MYIVMKKIIFYFTIIPFLFLTGCREDFFTQLINPTRTERVQGRIVEAYDSTKPIDSVFIEINIGLSDEVSTYTDANGNFDVSFDIRKWQGQSFLYSHLLYRTLDECDTLSDGTIQCYLEPIPTEFKIWTECKTNTPFIYDSASFVMESTSMKESKNAHTEHYINTNMDTVFYWTFTNPKPNEVRHYYWTVEDNSYVNLISDYFQNGNLIRKDTASIFCSKGIDTAYIILDE
ncbi:MAG: hypothetical protein L3J29_12820 [Cyclobacteriaceae bacterium]|nr:hypothetical protein [Cyclobacteriaceae bacterium]